MAKMPQVIGILFVVLLSGVVRGQTHTASGVSSKAPSGRIVNGTTVAIENYPFIVVLQVYGEFICGASIITTKHALTAAHCVDDRPKPGTLTLRAGSSSSTSGGVIFPVSNYIINPKYSKQRINYDAAVLTITGSFAGQTNVGTIPLQETEISLSSTSPTWCYALGWGYTNGTTETLPTNLQFVWLQLESYNSCAAVWGSAITSQMICAQYANVDMCNGDSGGPLVCNGHLTGIVSFGAQGCPGLYPAVFTKVSSSAILSFIKKNTKI